MVSAKGLARLWIEVSPFYSYTNHQHRSFVIYPLYCHESNYDTLDFATINQSNNLTQQAHPQLQRIKTFNYEKDIFVYTSRFQCVLLRKRTGHPQAQNHLPTVPCRVQLP
jgi:hypothetical protein